MAAVTSSRLASIEEHAPLIDVAKLLTRTQIGLIVICRHDRTMVGVLTKSDVVRQMGQCAGGSCQTRAADVMARQVTFCRPGDQLADVLLKMQTQDLVHVPVIDAGQKPIGVVNARDALRQLMAEEQYEESLLRNYVMGVGYQ